MTDPQKSLTFRYIGFLLRTNFHKSTKYHLITPRKHILQKVSTFDSPNAVPLFQHILTRSDIKLSRGPEVGRIQSVHISYHYLAWSDLLPTNIWLSIISSSHDFFCWIYYQSYLYTKPSEHLLVFCSQYIIIPPEKLSSFQLSVVDLFLGKFPPPPSP